MALLRGLSGGLPTCRWRVQRRARAVLVLEGPRAGTQGARRGQPPKSLSLSGPCPAPCRPGLHGPGWRVLYVLMQAPFALQGGHLQERA